MAVDTDTIAAVQAALEAAELVRQDLELACDLQRHEFFGSDDEGASLGSSFADESLLSEVQAAELEVRREARPATMLWPVLPQARCRHRHRRRAASCAPNTLCSAGCATNTAFAAAQGRTAGTRAARRAAVGCCAAGTRPQPRRHNRRLPRRGAQRRRRGEPGRDTAGVQPRQHHLPTPALRSRDESRRAWRGWLRRSHHLSSRCGGMAVAGGTNAVLRVQQHQGCCCPHLSAWGTSSLVFLGFAMQATRCGAAASCSAVPPTRRRCSSRSAWGSSLLRRWAWAAAARLCCWDLRQSLCRRCAGRGGAPPSPAGCAGLH